MITYVCLAVLLLFVAARSFIYWRRNREWITSEELDQSLLHQINQESDRYGQ